MEKSYKKDRKVKPQRFNIDFFEFAFLVETCIPPTPIARAHFWQKVIDKHYFELSQDERDRLFEWINRNGTMQEGIKNGNEDCLLFNARFDRDNQYLVHYDFGSEKSTKEAFLYKGEYHISKSSSIIEEYITKVEKLKEIV